MFTKLGSGPFAFSTTTVQRIAARKFLRVSIIPYVQLEGVNHYGLFVDANYREVCDAGGGARQSESFVTEAIRELYEESLGLFDLRRQPERLNGCVCYFQDGRVSRVYVLCEFTMTAGEMRVISDRFRTEYERTVLELMAGPKVPAHHIENCFMLWVPEPTLRQLTADRATPSRVELPGAEYYSRMDEAFVSRCQALVAAQPVGSFGRELFEKYLAGKPRFGDTYPKLWEKFRQLTSIVYGAQPTLV